MSSSDLLKLNIIDEIIPEPVGGAHRDKDLILDNVRDSLKKNLDFFQTMDKDEILTHRKNKFLSIGRNKGFTTQSDDGNDLSMKANVFESINQNFKKNSKIYYGVSAAVLLALFLSILL
jgi:acetyl-CoA carboxylase carboxyl transferase subunit alpha